MTSRPLPMSIRTFELGLWLPRFDQAGIFLRDSHYEPAVTGSSPPDMLGGSPTPRIHALNELWTIHLGRFALAQLSPQPIEALSPSSERATAPFGHKCPRNLHAEFVHRAPLKSIERVSCISVTSLMPESFRQRFKCLRPPPEFMDKEISVGHTSNVNGWMEQQ